MLKFFNFCAAMIEAVTKYLKKKDSALTKKYLNLAYVDNFNPIYNDHFINITIPIALGIGFLVALVCLCVRYVSFYYTHNIKYLPLNKILEMEVLAVVFVMQKSNILFN